VGDGRINNPAPRGNSSLRNMADGVGKRAEVSPMTATEPATSGVGGEQRQPAQPLSSAFDEQNLNGGTEPLTSNSGNRLRFPHVKYTAPQYFFR